MSDRRVAAFVSPHGFGHAARTAAVLEALGRLVPGVSADLYTTVPEWFFRESLSIPFTRHELACDVGLAQRTALEEDPLATVVALERLWPPAPERLAALAEALRSRGTRLVLCDMPALGVAAARAAGLRVALVESFTWSFVYTAYREEAPRLVDFGEAFDAELAAATWRFRAEPFCGQGPGTAVAPIAREPRTPPAEVRARLGVEPGRPLVLVSMGGVPWRFDKATLAGAPDAGGGRARPFFVVPGGAETERREGDFLLLPHHSPVHHPDLVAAADAVVGKLGYSTVAEAARVGARFAWLPRPRFPESPVLADWVEAHLPSLALAVEEFTDGRWMARVDSLLARPAGAAVRADGAATVASVLAAALG